MNPTSKETEHKRTSNLPKTNIYPSMSDTYSPSSPANSQNIRTGIRKTRPHEANDRGKGPVLIRIALSTIVIGSSGAFQVFVPGTLQGNFTLTPLFIGFALVVFGALSPETRFLKKSFKPLPLMLLCFVPLLSALWSVNGAKTINVCATLILFGILGISIAASLSLEQRVKTITTVLGILLILSVATAILLPSFGIDQDSRGVAWRGIFQNKNSFGRVAAIEFLLSIFMFIKIDSQHKYRWLILALFCILVMLKSGSQTALIAALVSAGITLVIYVLKWSYKSAKTLSIVFSSIYTTLSISIPLIGPVIAGYVSRDPTLTGRTVLWDFSDYYANLRPWFGWGFGTIWQTDQGVGGLISSELTFISGSAHNGLLDIRLQVGIIGLLFILTGLCVLIYRAFSSFIPNIEKTWVAGYLVLYFVMDLTESTLFFGLTWFLLWILLSPAAESRRISK